MMVTHCDLCKKKIKDNKPITVSFSYYARAELCEKCGKFALKFLRKNKFIKEDKIEKS